MRVDKIMQSKIRVKGNIFNIGLLQVRGFITSTSANGDDLSIEVISPTPARVGSVITQKGDNPPFLCHEIIPQSYRGVSCLKCSRVTLISVSRQTDQAVDSCGRYISGLSVVHSDVPAVIEHGANTLICLSRDFSLLQGDVITVPSGDTFAVTQVHKLKAGLITGILLRQQIITQYR